MKIIMAALMAGVLAAGGVARAQEVPSKMKDRLSAMRITLDFNNAKLDEVIAYFQEFTGLNFHLDPAARKDDDSRVTLKLKDVTVMTALKLILKPRDLACVHRDGVIVIASKASLGSQTTTRVYEARDLMHGLQDFPGPRMELTAPGTGAALVGVIFDLADEPRVALPADVLVDLIRANTGGGSWEDSATSTSIVNGLLIISQSKQVHDEIQALLDQLRHYK